MHCKHPLLSCTLVVNRKAISWYTDFVGLLICLKCVGLHGVEVKKITKGENNQYWAERALKTGGVFEEWRDVPVVRTNNQNQNIRQPSSVWLHKSGAIWEMHSKSSSLRLLLPLDDVFSNTKSVCEISVHLLALHSAAVCTFANSHFIFKVQKKKGFCCCCFCFLRVPGITFIF